MIDEEKGEREEEEEMEWREIGPNGKRQHLGICIQRIREITTTIESVTTMRMYKKRKTRTNGHTQK